MYGQSWLASRRSGRYKVDHRRDRSRVAAVSCSGDHGGHSSMSLKAAHRGGDEGSSRRLDGPHHRREPRPTSSTGEERRRSRSPHRRHSGNPSSPEEEDLWVAVDEWTPTTGPDTATKQRDQQEEIFLLDDDPILELPLEDFLRHLMEKESARG